MALTKEDLQAIRDLMREETESIKADIAGLKESQQSIRVSQLKVELEQYPRIAAALDGVVAGIEKNEAQDERIVALEKKTDNHNTRIYALEESMKKAL